jgi:hypothetical protein
MSPRWRHTVISAACLVLPAGWAAHSRAGTQPGPRTIDTVALPARADGLRWHVVNSATAPGERVVEMVPDGQSKAAWSQIVTVKTLDGRDPLAVVNGTVDLLRKICRTLHVVRVAHHQSLGKTAGPDRKSIPLPVIEVDEVLLTCRDPDPAKLPADQPVALRPVEVTWYKIMRCGGLGYIVQRGWHGSAFGGTVLGSPAVLDAWKRWMTSVTILREARGPGAPPTRASPPI